MPLQSNDIATQMGDLIASNMGDTALTFRNNAPNDKTYVVTILGVGQEFTDDVAQAEQESIVKKYNIPAVSNDGTIYYTFKLEGIYYSVRQNGNFKLYEQTLLRVPNNNWDRMFLERLESGDTVAESNGTHIFTDIQEPPLPSAEGAAFSESNKLIQQGDTYVYWVVATDIGGYKELYIPVQGVDNLYYWEKVNMVCASEAPIINSKDVSDSGGKLYWIEVKDNKIKGIYKAKKDTSSETNIFKYKWDTENNWSYDSEFEDYSITREYALPTRYSGTIDGYQADMYNPCIYLSNSAPVQLGDIWYKINDFVSCELMQICEHKIGITGKQSWIVVCNIAGNGEGEYYYGHNIIVSDEEPVPISEKDIPDVYKHSRPDASEVEVGYTYVTCSLESDGNKTNITFVQAYRTIQSDAEHEWSNIDFYTFYLTKRMTNAELEKLLVPDEYDLSRWGKIAIVVPYDFDFFDPKGHSDICIYTYSKSDSQYGKQYIYIDHFYGRDLQPEDIEYVGDSSINEGDYWAKVNNMTDKKLMSFHECVGGKWQLLYTAYTPTIYALPTDPTTINDANNNPIYNVQVGDYWAKTDGDSSNNITEFYQRISTIDEQTQKPVESWEKMFNCNGSGGGQTVTINIENAIIVDKSNVLLEEDVPNG